MSIFQASSKAALNLDERGGGTGGDSQLSGGKEELGETEQKAKDGRRGAPLWRGAGFVQG